MSSVPCPCGLEAQRVAVYQWQTIIGETVPRGNARRNVLNKHGVARTDLFQEASQEWDYTHMKAEAEQERSLPSPSAWRAAKQEANRTP